MTCVNLKLEFALIIHKQLKSNNKMKTKNIGLIAAALLISVSANAQSYYNTRHEIGVTVGSGANTEIFSGLADFSTVLVEATVSSIITGGTVTAYYNYGDESYIPSISVEYYYHVNPIIALGGYVAFNGMNRDMYYTWTDNVNHVDHKVMNGEAKRRNISFIPTAKFDWLRKKHFGLYSKAGFGMSIMYETQETKESTDFSDTTIIPNIHLTLIGIEAGSETWRGFMEYGLGEQGIICAGLKYKF